ncbi:MAG TPA: BatA domain-containing protein [Phycisphaerae bacterium]|nr:BatA domain-containing protein [Phycisphaerae bacterium]
MQFLAPWSLVGWVLVPAIFLWGLWRPRGRPVMVGSLMLWRRALGSGPAGKPSARIRLRDPILWLDALAVLVAVLACARPAVRWNQPTEPVATIVVDRTASMTIASDGGNRRQRAMEMARGALEALGDAPVRLVSIPGPAGPYAVESVTGSAAEAVRALEPSLAAADIRPVVLSEAAGAGGRPVLVLTDVAPAEPLPKGVYVFAPGGRSANAGLERIATRIEAGRWWVLVSARAAPGAGGAAAPYGLRIADGAGKILYETKSFLKPGGRTEKVFEMNGPPAETLHVSLVGPADGFPADDEAFLVLEPARRLRVLLVGKPNRALSRALGARPDTVVAENAESSAPAPLAKDIDLVVANESAIPAAWRGPAATVLPLEAVGPVHPTEREAAGTWRVEPGHPLAGAFYLEPPRIGRVRRYALDAAAQLVLGTRETPLIVTWREDGRRRMAVLFSFGEMTTDWPRRAGFPVFWSRAMEWLAGGDRRPSEVRTRSGAEHRTQLPQAWMNEPSEQGPGEPGFYEVAGRRIGVSFIGTDEGFQEGPGRDEEAGAKNAIRRSVESRRRVAMVELWPTMAGAILVLVLARAWLAR